MMTRRRFVQSAAIASSLMATSTKVLAGQKNPVVQTSYGKVRGQVHSGVSVFKGIRYGATTAGANRFLPPTVPKPWSGTQDVIDYGDSAAQVRFGLAGSEDCLFLNVWTPSDNDNGKRPVMVWLHGGGFSSGSGSSPGYDGVNLCNQEDVVVVTLNHRLNVLGSTQLSEVISDEFTESGCVGMLDIVAALRWIRDNIASFGGDPGRVMIFGVSGGGRKVSTLLAMPVAKGLFHRAVIQSGAILRVTTPQDGTRFSEMLLSELGLTRSNARKLQTVPLEDMMRAYQDVQKNYQPTIPVVGMAGSTPVINPISLPAHPYDPVAPHVSADVPVMVGHNRTEETYFYRVGELLYPQTPNRPMDFDLSAAELLERVQQKLGTDSGTLIEAYRSDYPKASPWDLLMLISTDYPRGIYPKELARRKAALGQAKAYVYRFDWELNDEVKSSHVLEIPFVFANTRTSNWTRDHPGHPHELSKKMSAAWAAFARTGNPNTMGLPEWGPYDGDKRSTMIFNNPSRTEEDPHRRSRIAMEKVLGFS